MRCKEKKKNTNVFREIAQRHHDRWFIKHFYHIHLFRVQNTLAFVKGRWISKQIHVCVRNFINEYEEVVLIVHENSQDELQKKKLQGEEWISMRAENQGKAIKIEEFWFQRPIMVFYFLHFTVHNITRWTPFGAKLHNFNLKTPTFDCACSIFWIVLRIQTKLLFIIQTGEDNHQNFNIVKSEVTKFLILIPLITQFYKSKTIFFMKKDVFKFSSKSCSLN